MIYRCELFIKKENQIIESWEKIKKRKSEKTSGAEEIPLKVDSNEKSFCFDFQNTYCIIINIYNCYLVIISTKILIKCRPLLVRLNLVNIGNEVCRQSLNQFFYYVVGQKMKVGCIKLSYNLFNRKPNS